MKSEVIGSRPFTAHILYTDPNLDLRFQHVPIYGGVRDTAYVEFTTTEIKGQIYLINRDALSTPYITDEDRKQKIFHRAIQYFNTVYGDIYGKWNYDGTFKP
jgi:hypothetical protein